MNSLSSVSSVNKGFTHQAGLVQCFNYRLSFWIHTQWAVFHFLFSFIVSTPILGPDSSSMSKWTLVFKKGDWGNLIFPGIHPNSQKNWPEKAFSGRGGEGLSEDVTYKLVFPRHTLFHIRIYLWCIWKS